jgi:hypothetical protein
MLAGVAPFLLMLLPVAASGNSGESAAAKGGRSLRATAAPLFFCGSNFRIPYSVFPIPYSLFRIPYSPIPWQPHTRLSGADSLGNKE